MVSTHVTIPAGSALVLQAGVIVKFTAGYEVSVNGTLTTNGTAQYPVIFTDDADDSAGGDTNNNGASVGSPASWRGLVFSSTQTGSVLNWTEARYGGSGYVSNFHLNSASPTFVHCTSRNNYTDGMQLNASSLPTVTDCTFNDNNGVAVAGMPLAAVAGFTNCVASGNAGGNYMQVTSATVDGYLKIGPQSILNGALMVATHVTVGATGTLVVEQGVAFKFTAGYEVTVNGAIDLRGTGYEPIVFTDDADDSVAGDTNNNGPSVGSPASWRGVVVTAGAGPSRIENVVIRYPGSGYVPGLTSSSPNLTVRAVRVDRGYDRGFALSALASSPTNLIAWGCGGYGIHVSAGTFDLVHATSTGNGTGIRRETAWTGYVHNSIVYGNATNFSNFGTGTTVMSCNGGFTSVNNNVNVDPLFVDGPNGDLHLGASSPCLGLGQFYPAQYAAKDFDENSRMLDHALVGWPAPDLGAYELPAWTMAVGGVARPGSTLTFTLSGPSGDSFVGLGLLDGATPILPYGMLLAGQSPGISVALLYPVTLPVGFPIPLPLVNSPQLLGIAAGIQTLTFPTGNWTVGNFTRLYRMLIRP
jgi:hypothetical protein